MGSGEQVVRVGFIGAGAIAQYRHLPALKAIDGVQLAVVCNRRPESSARIAAEFGIPDVAASWEDVVIRPDIDVVWIGTAPNLHAEITLAALESGKHVFCQARMAMNLSEARSMLAAAESHPNQVTMLCPPPTALKHGAYFEKLLRDRAIGRIYHFNLRALNAQWADPSAPAHWRQRLELSGNNIMSVGIYGEVLGRFLGDPVSVCAQGAVYIRERQGYAVRIPDCLQVLGEWPDQVLGTLQWSGVALHGGNEQIEIFGSEGTLVYDFSTDEIFLGRPSDAGMAPLTIPREFKREWTVEQDFIRAVREGGYPEPSFHTGVRYMEFVEAIQHSMAQSAWIRLSEL
ncbi:MAG: Gfo/Idh/MocA family oxidoreductase [Terracidiphilus sp.]